MKQLSIFDLKLKVNLVRGYTQAFMHTSIESATNECSRQN